MAHHTTRRQAEEDRYHIENPDESEMDEALVALLMRRIVVAGSGGVFDGAVVGHGETLRVAQKGGRTGVSAIAAQGQRRRTQPLVDGCNPTLVSAALCRAATSPTAKRSIASLNNR